MTDKIYCEKCGKELSEDESEIHKAETQDETEYPEDEGYPDSSDADLLEFDLDEDE